MPVAHALGRALGLIEAISGLCCAQATTRQEAAAVQRERAVWPRAVAERDQRWRWGARISGADGWRPLALPHSHARYYSADSERVFGGRQYCAEVRYTAVGPSGCDICAIVHIL